MQISDSDISSLSGAEEAPSKVVEKTSPLQKVKSAVGLNKEKEKIEITDMTGFLDKSGRDIIMRGIQAYEEEQKRKFVAFTFKILLSFALLVILYLVGTKNIIPSDYLVILIAVLIGFIFGSYRS